MLFFCRIYFILTFNPTFPIFFFFSFFAILSIFNLKRWFSVDAHENIFEKSLHYFCICEWEYFVMFKYRSMLYSRMLLNAFDTYQKFPNFIYCYLLISFWGKITFPFRLYCRWHFHHSCIPARLIAADIYAVLVEWEANICWYFRFNFRNVWIFQFIVCKQTCRFFFSYQ